MIRILEGFDHWDGSVAQGVRKWDTVGTWTRVPGRFGGYGLITIGNPTALTKVLDTQQTWFFRGAYYYKHAAIAVTNVNLFSLWDGVSLQCAVGLEPPHHLVVRRGATKLAETGELPRLSWMHIEAKLVVAAAGSYEVRINGVTVLSAAGVDMTMTANESADKVALGGDGYTCQDDVCIADGTGGEGFIGDKRVVTRMPTGNGHYADWTPSAGPNWQCVDEETPNDDTDYVSSATVGHKDSYDMAAVGMVGLVSAVQILACVRKDDAGVHTARLLTRSGGGDSFGTAEAIGDSYQYLRQVRETDPATGVAWTVAGVDAMEAGVDIVS